MSPYTNAKESGVREQNTVDPVSKEFPKLTNLSCKQESKHARPGGGGLW